MKVNAQREAITSILNTNENDIEIETPELNLEEITIECKIMNVTSNQSNNHSSNRIELLKRQLRLKHLNEEAEHSVFDICKNFSDIFFLEGDTLTCTDTISHRIETTTDKPISSKIYRYPEIHKEEVKNQIEKMLKDKIIQSSKSPWNSPLWVVPKKKRNLRSINGNSRY